MADLRQRTLADLASRLAGLDTEREAAQKQIPMIRIG